MAEPISREKRKHQSYVITKSSTKKLRHQKKVFSLHTEVGITSTTKKQPNLKEKFLKHHDVIIRKMLYVKAIINIIYSKFKKYHVD